MEQKVLFFFGILAATVTAEHLNVNMKFDRPSLRVPVSHTAEVRCCYICKCELQVIWVQNVIIQSKNSKVINVSLTDERVKTHYNQSVMENVHCHHLELKNVVLNDTGLYQCMLAIPDNTRASTPGTFVQVYEPIHKVLNISEKIKNSIITAEGVLLLLCMLLPGSILFCKKKKLNVLQKKKGKEEENIYEGLNLDECNSTYHQIQRSLDHGPYEDVMNPMEEDIQLEKP